MDKSKNLKSTAIEKITCGKNHNENSHDKVTRNSKTVKKMHKELLYIDFPWVKLRQ